MTSGMNSFDTRATLHLGGQDYAYYSLKRAEARFGSLRHMPYSLRVLLENMLRKEDGLHIGAADIEAFAAPAAGAAREIQFYPARVLMQDFSGTACLADLAAMRDAMPALGKSPKAVNPAIPVHLVIDHSVMVDHAGSADAFERNLALDYARNAERYAFLRWGARSLDNFHVVPPGQGICHQINIENIARVVWSEQDGEAMPLLYPDSCVGTDSHTTMVNGLGVLGWGVGGIEAEAAMLGHPVSMLRPQVTGVRLTGALPEGTTATDLVLRVTQLLRARGVVGRFVEFCGPGLETLPVADRATLANMAPEYGATCGYFPIDRQTIAYLRLTGRDEALVTLVEAYARAQDLWRDPADPEPSYDDLVELDLSAIVPSLAGPRRPQDRVDLPALATGFADALPGFGVTAGAADRHPVKGRDFDLGHGDIVIAAITSCTNTSNPVSVITAGLLARKARAMGLSCKPWVKRSFAPGSRVVSDYLKRARLQDDLDALGFHLVGYGCATCVGNSGPLADDIAAAITDNRLVTSAILSGNRNFEGRISPLVRANYLASPALVVAYALLGTTARDIMTEPLGADADGRPVHLRDIWPSAGEVADLVARFVTRAGFSALAGDVFTGDARWSDLPADAAERFPWQAGSTYIARPDFFDGMSPEPTPPDDVLRAAPIAILGDSITTDHISPVGQIAVDSPAGHYLRALDVAPEDFNSYGTRRGNHEVMVRGTFANVRIRNEMVPGIEGGMTLHQGQVMPIHDAALRFCQDGIPLVIVAGKEYGTGSARDWAAKGTAAIGVRVVIAESFERIHRANLVGMGVLPLQFMPGEDRHSLGLCHSDRFTILDLADLEPLGPVTVRVDRADGSSLSFETLCRIDTMMEKRYFLGGGILKSIARSIG
ncbi:aconitate hydratase 1 [Sphingobium sp. LB126]|uniref:aconitate hydratase AcnA n=1 Tax=Sphingobium sp. LB126 TaxID=1983755 RepID=UPI000C20F613|nr:aconitate hydratase AcnA [Sphingobium sp. LB126]PJG46197.1 aconitate hydratase 1 [Sphingobium sp. LB126]